ncbi:ketopantoate reductase family protein [Paenibacillus chartarius]|uniref:2-dehydropantoate 2-reductase n=1 Tax=Paenibacillus chartarius TaxID=747481 RepID=A0ABV6DU94_9BACL
MHIAIIGAGSVGLLLAGKLAASGAARITVVTRAKEQADALNEKGITVTSGRASARGNVTAIPFAVWSSSQALELPYDWVFLTVKQQAIDSLMLNALGAMNRPVNGLVCWQNGVGHIERIADVFPLDRIYIAVTTEGARRLALSEVAHTGTGHTELGAAAGQVLDNASQPMQKILEGLLNQAGFQASVSKHIVSSIWYKLLVNAVVNPLTALVRKPNGELLASDETATLIRSLAKEGLSVALAEGAELDEDSVLRRIQDVCRRTADNRSSMLQDVDAGRRTENEWVSGAVARLAAKHGLSVPATETIYRIIREWERGR